MKMHVLRKDVCLERNNSEKNWSLIELDNHILIIAPYVSNSLYLLTYICHGQHAEVFDIRSDACGAECMNSITCVRVRGNPTL